MKRFSLWLILGLMSSASMVAQNYKITVKGKVCNQLGHGIPEVVVNDGVNFVKTDLKGEYRIVADTTRSKFITITTPAAYMLPQKDGIAYGFYVPINKLKGKSVRTHNFILDKREKESDKFYYIAISDPQINDEHDYKRWCNETVKDMKAEISRMDKEHQVIGMTLGDMVFSKRNIWEPFKKSIENTGMTTFMCIGNHDMIKSIPSLENSPKGAKIYSEMDFMNYFGPTDYSFNIGKIHVVTINNINNMQHNKYVEMLTPGKLEWLKKDLSYIPKGSMIFLNMHAAGWNKWYPYANMHNTPMLDKLLEGYDVHVFCGHSHFFQDVDVNEHLYQHNIGAACGAWWWGDVNRCGAPNGYMIVNVDGTKVRCIYKATGKSTEYQIHLYNKGEFRTQKEFVVANIWDYDDKCSVEWIQDGVNKGRMEQFKDKDEEYTRIKNEHHVNLPECYTDHLFRVKPEKGAKKIEIIFTNHYGEKYKESITL